MRILTATTLSAVLLVLPLTACANAKDAQAGTEPTVTTDDTPTTPDAPVVPVGEKPKPFGTTTTTVGAGGKGELAVTPTTVVYVTRAGEVRPDGGLFAVVTVKDKATGQEPAGETALTEGGGWQWTAGTGRPVDQGDGTSAFKVNPSGFEGSGDIRPGAHEWRSLVFDISATQQSGASLVYVDGEDVTHRWTVPAQDTGPQVTELKKVLEE